MSTKQLQFVFARDRVITTPFGHVFRFEKDVPLAVPPSCAQIVEDSGGIVVEGEIETKTSNIPQGDARIADVDAAIASLVEANHSNDFTASGSPKVDAISRLLGWPASGEEVKAAWAKFKQAENNASNTAKK
jgi:hypothetical protein